ncbi:hypothetical protein ACFE04_010743 [Oxalis oulophora]
MRLEHEHSPRYIYGTPNANDMEEPSQRISCMWAAQYDSHPKLTDLKGRLRSAANANWGSSRTTSSRAMRKRKRKRSPPKVRSNRSSTTCQKEDATLETNREA